jgi:nitrate reductase NapE component
MLMMYLCPTPWQAHAAKTMGLWKIQLFLNTVFFPLLVVALMRGLGFIKNFYMRDTRERLGPMMAIMLFYFWNFWVFHKLTATPEVFRAFLLSTFVCISLLFLATIFVKVSLHTAGIVGAAIALSFWSAKYDCNLTPALVVVWLLAFAVPFARLQLAEHTKAELVLGALIGAFSTVLVMLVY